MSPTITSIEIIEFIFLLENVGTSPNGFCLAYEPDTTTNRQLFAIRIHTDTGTTGEYLGGNSPGAAEINMFAQYLIGKILLTAKNIGV